MGWISVKDRLPESGERVLVYWYEANIDLHQMALLEYFRKGDTVAEETTRRADETPEQFLLSLLRGGRGERAVAEDGFYIYDADATTGLCRWRKHADCITHWMPMPDAPDETEDGPETNADKIRNAAYALTKTLESISPAITRLYRLSGLLKMDAPDIIISNEARMALEYMTRVYRDVGDAIRETRELWERTRKPFRLASRKGEMAMSETKETQTYQNGLSKTCRYRDCSMNPVCYFGGKAAWIKSCVGCHEDGRNAEGGDDATAFAERGNE